MRILADTNIFIWCDRSPARLRPALLSVLRDSRNEVFVSAASVWEVAIKRALRKLTFVAPIVDAVDRLGFTLLPINGSHAEHAGGLPRHHGDPFDRLIVAQADIEGLVLATSDRTLAQYGIAILCPD